MAIELAYGRAPLLPCTCNKCMSDPGYRAVMSALEQNLKRQAIASEGGDTPCEVHFSKSRRPAKRVGLQPNSRTIELSNGGEKAGGLGDSEQKSLGGNVCKRGLGYGGKVQSSARIGRAGQGEA
jgi:hypothetical protein